MHRDLKPANLFLARKPNGRSSLKVLDFGIAKLTGGDDDVALTNTKGHVGSPLYMSPEQLQAPKSVDHRTDVWALGTVLYELVSGQAPFIAGAVALVYAKILATEAPPLREFLPDAPPELEAVLARCLQKRPEDRYATVADLAVALAPFAPKSALPCVTAAVRTLRGSSLDRGDLPILPNESVPPPPALAVTAVAQAGSDAVTVADVGPTVPAVSPLARALRTIEIDNTLPATATSEVVSSPRRSVTPLVMGAGLVVALGLGGALFWNHSGRPSAEIVAASTSSASVAAVAPEVPPAAPRSEAPRLEVVPVPAELPATIPSASPRAGSERGARPGELWTGNFGAPEGAEAEGRPRVRSVPGASKVAFMSFARVVRRLHRGALAAAFFLAIHPAAALAQEAEANVLFDQGRALMGEKRFEEAAQKFEFSQALDPAVGTLLNMAECYVALGRTASAWSAFRDAAGLAAANKQPERERYAEKRAKELEADLSTLVLVVPEAARVEGLIVTRDARGIGEAVWGTPVPVDPGPMRLDATAPGREPWTVEVSVGKKRDRVEIVLPVLAATPAKPAPEPVAEPASPSPAVAAAPPAPGARALPPGEPEKRAHRSPPSRIMKRVEPRRTSSAARASCSLESVSFSSSTRATSSTKRTVPTTAASTASVTSRFTTKGARSRARAT